MKKMVVVMLCFLSFGVLAGEINVKVSGMVCSMCAQGIEKKFSNVKAVQDIKVDLDNKVVSIKTKDGMLISDKEINLLIKEAGYNVTKIERK